MKVYDFPQGGEEWVKIRCGVPTSSNFYKIVTTLGNPSEQRERYLHHLSGERICMKPEETYKNAVMQRGTEMEGEARSLYELITGETVQQVGFCLSDDGLYGCSPDGLIGEYGGYETKCPTMAVHVSYLLDGGLPTDYFQQVQGSLLVTGRKWWDFMSYYPAMKPLIIRVFPDPKFQAVLKAELETACKELEEITKKIR